MDLMDRHMNIVHAPRLHQVRPLRDALDVPAGVRLLDLVPHKDVLKVVLLSAAKGNVHVVVVAALNPKAN